MVNKALLTTNTIVETSKIDRVYYSNLAIITPILVLNIMFFSKFSQKLLSPKNPQKDYVHFSCCGDRIYNISDEYHVQKKIDISSTHYLSCP